MKRYVIIGTDTNCGKTYVTCQLLAHLKAKGSRAMAIKPVASGVVEKEGRLVNEDVARLQEYNGALEPAICSWVFNDPVSPHLAAKVVGQHVSAGEVVAFCESSKFQDTDYLFIESAGGLMSPLNDDETWLDVLLKSRIPVLLVVGMRLGCLNHALLTASVLKANRIPCVGWIANVVDNTMLLRSQNIETLTLKMDWPRLATLAHAGTFTDAMVLP